MKLIDAEALKRYLIDAVGFYPAIINRAIEKQQIINDFHIDKTKANEIKDKTLDDLIKKHEWKEYDGEDKGFHYCSKCGQAAFNYEDGNEVAELLSDFCPWCGEPLTKNGWNKLRKRLEGMK